MAHPPSNPVPAAIPPSHSEFDEEGYLHLYPDIARGVNEGVIVSGWQHFMQHGRAEGRQWISRPDPFAGVSRMISPGDEMIHGNEDHYFSVGESAIHCIEAALQTARCPKAGIRRILDLPCGHGRVMRFLRKSFPEAVLTACDLNADGVAYCARNFGAIPVVSCEDVASIRLAGGFDLIWCGSLLTHLGAAQSTAFIDLFQRLLRPGGITVFTTHGRSCEREISAGKNRHNLEPAQIAALLEQYRQTGFAYVDYVSHPGYGFSLAHPAYVLDHFVSPTVWRVIGYHENGWDKCQDVICLQKRFPDQPA